MIPTLARRRRGRTEPTTPLEEFLGRVTEPWWAEWPAEEEMTGAYPVDICEQDGKVVVDAEMPGFKRDEIDVRIDNGVLRISAERKPEEHKGTRHVTERRYTRVERAFSLPTSVDESKVEARLQDGVLHLELPESEDHKPKRIEVK